MDLHTKHQIGKNKVGLYASMIISASIMLITALGFVERIQPALVLRFFLCVAIILFNLVSYSKCKEKEVYRHCCCCSMLVLFAITIFTATASYMYAIIFPMSMLVMIFSDNRLVLIGGIIEAIGIVVYDMKMLLEGTAGVAELIVAFLFAGVASWLAIMITKLQNQQNGETLREIGQATDGQLETSKKIVELANALNQKFVSAQQVSDHLNESMSTSHNSVNEIAENTKVNAEAIEQQTNQTSDIQMSIQAVGEEAKNMGAISEKTKSTVEEGVDLIHQLKSQAMEVAKINTETKTTTQQLNDSIQDVQAITETILGISSQTNLLALNASIEAARAGEAGKGFAVVADEIRNLSEDTRKATEQISAIIAKLTKDAESAAISMTQSAEYAEKQHELIELTGEKLTDIKDDTNSLYDGVLQVNHSVDSIISAASLIMDSITNLSATGEQVAASSDTALSISDSAMSALDDMNRLLGDISEISSTMQSVAQ